MPVVKLRLVTPFRSNVESGGWGAQVVSTCAIVPLQPYFHLLKDTARLGLVDSEKLISHRQLSDSDLRLTQITANLFPHYRKMRLMSLSLLTVNSVKQGGLHP